MNFSANLISSPLVTGIIIAVVVIIVIAVIAWYISTRNNFVRLINNCEESLSGIDVYLKKRYDGQLFLMIFCWYGFGRMFIEGLRTDSLYTNIFGLEFRTSQILAAAIFIATLALLIYFAIRKPNKPLYHKPPKKVEEKKKKAK